MSKLLPTPEVIFATIGYSAYKTYNDIKAKNYFQQVLEMDPDFAEVQYYLSLVLRKEGKIEQADEFKNLSNPYSRHWIIDK